VLGVLSTITDVQPLDAMKLRVRFKTGEWRIVDIGRFGPFVGVFEPLRDPREFARVRVHPELGTLVWPSGADLCPDVIYAESTPEAERAAS
jgi:hypothetical protein